MSLRIFPDPKRTQQALFHEREESSAATASSVGWPKDTWFQRRLNYVREQQRRKAGEADIVYECALGTIIVRQPNTNN